MSLYGDLPQARHKESSAGDPTAWSASRLLKSGFRTTLALPPSVLRKQKPPSAPAPPRPNSRSGVTSVTRRTEDDTSGDASSGLFSLFGEVADEYDPARPNDYEAVVQERERKRREAELEADRQERLRVEKERQASGFGTMQGHVAILLIGTVRKKARWVFVRVADDVLRHRSLDQL